ncbi:c-type cytochrome biogenesis protein CcsB [Amycolatopsis acidiphila]|uniref:C-type cytochrome biogenesis protein CcsB n=1 Tax=Amycolatopsis acidiphila TaxID=715473 RepID=A0A557ZZZ8_9PSEU|nr:c-type cytochrome biogenesis protein CcsB [Amycolatopsis acidiphila]TVT17574.1 c-type cytochrome biogenesis protein CcsB [Amycolatopsis acidiphila]UIJ60520.1 c-type cytochrome biogenesis protein CcsB [Amycolatopsis acidiphila]GHG82376.1 c-type cytochrome biogenesis protein CcsB [Amycolatopsis acidiphila]
MPVNETLSQYSDWSYTTATAIYVLALVFFLIEQSFGAKGRSAAERTRARQLVGAGAPVDVAEVTTDVPPARRGRAERIGRMGAALTVLGVLLHLSALVLRGLATHRVPWGNMYEYIMAVTFIAVVTWLYVIRKFPVRHLSGFMLLPIVILMFIGGTALYTVAAPVVPALQSYWLWIHVTAAIISSGVFMVPGVASIFYLVRNAHERNPQRFARFAPKLPAADVLDRIAYRATVLAFPLFTFGVLCGAVWAESAWGRFWGWDPKETTAFVAWVVYAAYLHSRATAGWRGTRAAAINIVGFAVMVFNLFFVNLVTTGLHSYAGVG